MTDRNMTWAQDEVRPLPLERFDERLHRYRLAQPKLEKSMAQSLELLGVVDLLLASSTQEQTAFVLGDPRRALRQADEHFIHHWDPRLSVAGNRIAKRLALLLDCDGHSGSRRTEARRIRGQLHDSSGPGQAPAPPAQQAAGRAV